MQELRDLAGVINLATWDQETYMPRKAEEARAAQLATLQGLYHERLTDPRVGDWLEREQPTSTDELAMLRVFKRERDRAVKLPARLVKAIAEAQARGLGAWREAREHKRFDVFRPRLETLVALRREQADAWGFAGGERYDAHLESYEPGMRVARLTPVLESLSSKLQPLIRAIEARPPTPDALEGKRFPIEAQWAFTFELLGAMGFDLEAGRQDRSIHPFSSGLAVTDVRLTTRLFEEQPFSAIFGTIHEAGHGLYEQGFGALARTPLAQAPSTGLHESQSRLWENVVGRSRPFWSHFFPRLKAHFPSQLAEVSLDQFLSSVTRVRRSFIRVDADEVTYNLHIALRYELELGLLRGSLAVADLEAAWNARTKALLGLEVTDPVLGVLQDIHWAWGEFGYFPTYSLGNLYGATLFAAARAELPSVMDDVAQGRLLGLRDWLREKVHRHGFRLDAEDLVRQVTGHGLRDDDFIAALTERYSH